MSKLVFLQACFPVVYVAATQAATHVNGQKGVRRAPP
jgi:hypothetical protein